MEPRIDEAVMSIASWFLQKKTRTGRNLPKNIKNVHFITLHFDRKQLTIRVQLSI